MAACSHAHDDQSGWTAWTEAAVYRAAARSAKRRNVTHRYAHFARACATVDCTFLARGTRDEIPLLLQQARYNGSSAEVGVWIGGYSSTLLRRWTVGGTHHLVDPYVAYREGCSTSGTGQWHCLHKQETFDRHYNQTRARFQRLTPRARMVRNFSLDAARSVARASLDFVYLDGRHDYDGVLEDLRAWAPRVCPGGVIAGHDYQEMQVARALQTFFSTSPWPWPWGGEAAGGSGALSNRTARVYVTTDNPASWLVFAPPAPRAVGF